MVLREVLETALNRFRTHPIQTWLTLAGLIVGTAAIILIVSLGLTGRGFYDIPDLDDHLRPLQELTVIGDNPETGAHVEFRVTCRIDTPVEVEYYRHGVVLPMVLRKLPR